MAEQEEWIKGAIHDPGVNADNRDTSMQFCVMHFTAGRDSRNIGKAGYFNALFPKVGAPYQYAGLKTLTWHAAQWNPYGPGLEFERMTADEPLTPDQEFWGGVTASILNRDFGIPLEHYQGPRFQAGNFHGFVNHGDLDDQRSDGVSDLEWLEMVKGDDMAISDEQMNTLGAWMQQQRDVILKTLVGLSGPDLPANVGVLAGYENDTRDVVRAESKAIKEAINSKVVVTGGQLDPKALAKSIVEELGVDISSKLADEIAARLAS